MTIRNALRQSTVLTFGLILAFLWVLLTAFGVWGTMDLGDAGYVGQGAVSGVVGLLVIAVALGLLVVLFGELAEDDPAPEPWPPTE